MNSIRVAIASAWVGLLMLAGASAAMAQTPGRVLPDFQLHDSQGTVVTTDLLRMQRNWVLVVVNPDLSNARNIYQSLASRESAVGAEITILLLGDARELNAAIADNTRLSAARWYRADPQTVKQRLNLTGFPILMGITPSNQIRWQQSGQPRAPEQLNSMIGSWIATASTDP